MRRTRWTGREMRALLDGTAPLRGRASLELVVQPFDFRTAAAFWKLDSNPAAAFEMFSYVGGTPAYVTFASGERPGGGNVEILTGLSAGEIIVFEGSDRIANGTPVTTEGRAPGSATPARSSMSISASPAASRSSSPSRTTTRQLEQASTPPQSCAISTPSCSRRPRSISPSSRLSLRISIG